MKWESKRDDEKKVDNKHPWERAKNINEHDDVNAVARELAQEENEIDPCKANREGGQAKLPYLK